MSDEMKKPRVVRSHDTHLDSAYVQWLYDVKQRFRNAQIKASVKVNSEQLLFNWQMGRDLVTRKVEDVWGAGIVEQVSLDLQNEFPETRGFSARNLWNMKKWYSFYALAPETDELLKRLSEEIDIGSKKMHQVGAEISEPLYDEKLHRPGKEMPFPAIFGFVPWRHHVEIVSRCKSVAEALFYVRKTIEDGLSRNALIDVVRADLYHRSGTALTNFSEMLPATQSKLAQEIIKDTYDLSFISLPQGYSEEALEDALEANITQFLLELGTGFAFVGRQKEIIVSGKTRKIDMLFYHIRLRCYVERDSGTASYSRADSAADRPR